MKAGKGDELQRAPGIGPSLSLDLRDLGIRSLANLARRNPERLYEQLNASRGVRQDPCVLYAFRCAVYFARTPRPKAELLKWWNWKGRRLSAGQAGPPRGARPRNFRESSPARRRS